MTGEFESKDTTRKQSRGGEGESEREKTEFGVCSLIQQTSAAVRVSPLLHMFSVLYAVLKGCRLQQPVYLFFIMQNTLFGCFTELRQAT